MRIKPIPKRLLIHSVEYREYVGNDGWDDGWAEPVIIDRVLVQPATAIYRSADREVVEAKHILFIDHVNSSHFPKMKEKSKVVFNGDEWTVHKVNPFYAFGPDPHHYEVELI